jgi:hypothetical protein
MSVEGGLDARRRDERFVHHEVLVEELTCLVATQDLLIGAMKEIIELQQELISAHDAIATEIVSEVQVSHT